MVAHQVSYGNAFIDEGFYRGPNTAYIQDRIPDDPTIVDPKDVVTTRFDRRAREIMIRDLPREFQRMKPVISGCGINNLFQFSVNTIILINLINREQQTRVKTGIGKTRFRIRHPQATCFITANLELLWRN